MEINKEMLEVKEVSAKLGANVMVEGDIIIPDVNPDVREVLLADAVASIHTSEVRNGKLYISGNVQFQILYAPDEDDCELKSLSAAFPFSDTLDIPGGSDSKEYTVSVLTEHIGFTLVNSRKISMKVIVSVKARGFENKTIAPISSVNGGKVQYRTTDYRIYTPVCEKHHDIMLSDLLTVPQNLPDMEDILKMDAWVGNSECKVMNGKVMVRGVLHTQTLYTAANETASIERVSHEIPFTEIIEAENVDDACHATVILTVKNITTTPRGDINGDTKIINAEATIHAVLKASKMQPMTFVDDCYTTEGALETKMQQATLSEFVSQDTCFFTESQKAAIPVKTKAGNILCVTCKPILQETVFENQSLVLRGNLVTFLLYREHKDNGKGKIRSAVTETPFVYTRPSAGHGLSVECDFWNETAVAEIAADGSVDIHATLCANLCVVKSVDTSFLAEIEWQETENSACDQPALIIYFTEDGDTLWNIAKKYGTTVEKIKTANGIEEDTLLRGRKILIPKAV